MIMKKILVVSCLVAFAMLSFKTDRLNSLPIGSALPKGDVLMKDVNGQTVTLQQSKKENGLLVMFSCNTCPVVRANQSRTKDICSFALNSKIGVTVVNSNEASRNDGESFESMQSYAKEQSFQWFYVLDKNDVLADAFGATRTPECFLFDKDNKLVYHGAIDDSPGDISSVHHHYLKQAIDEMVAGRSITVKESRSVGCTIHRM
jgi:thioredoxin-related protein